MGVDVVAGGHAAVAGDAGNRLARWFSCRLFALTLDDDDHDQGDDRDSHNCSAADDRPIRPFSPRRLRLATLRVSSFLRPARLATLSSQLFRLPFQSAARPAGARCAILYSLSERYDKPRGRPPRLVV